MSEERESDEQAACRLLVQVAKNEKSDDREFSMTRPTAS
jgi:hypothetical protein